jgi:peptidoglycan/xylan/chitin deacetylase (PgdA/CDA1 family)
MAVSPNNFEEHIKWLPKTSKFYHYRLKKQLGQGKIERNIYVTFDDAYMIIFIYKPILEKIHCPATFVSSHL